MLTLRPLALASVVTAVLACPACGRSSNTPATPPVKMMTCPPPIGAVPAEDCADIADDFGALQVSGALPLAGQGKGSGPRIEAIRAVEALADSIKQQRVKRCQAYVACKVPLADHEAQDKLLTGAMRSLIDLWNKRRFAGTGDVIRFREAVRALDLRVNGTGSAGPKGPPPKPPRTFKGEDALARVEDPGVAFRSGDGEVVVSATAEGRRPALRTKMDVVELVGGHHYRIKVMGRYAPAKAPLLAPGDELLARYKYRASAPVDITLGLRSVEDPEGSEVSKTFHADAGARGVHEAKLVADPLQTGFFLGVAVRGAPVDLDDIELVRGGNVIAAARGEGGEEPWVKTECVPSKDKPIAGKSSLRCEQSDTDRITLGEPDGYLVIGLRDSAGERAAVQTVSLEGGRSVDAVLREDGGEIVFTLLGAGSATITQLEVTDLGGGH